MSDFAASGLVREVRSKTLGETVLWAADNAKADIQTDLVVYRACELKELVDVMPELLRRIHMVKKYLDGEVVEKDEDTE